MMSDLTPEKLDELGQVADVPLGNSIVEGAIETIRQLKAALADREAGLRTELPLGPGEDRTVLSEPLRAEGVQCTYCFEPIEAYATQTIYGMWAGYVWRHCDGTYRCVHPVRRARPYDGYEAGRRIREAQLNKEEA